VKILHDNQHFPVSGFGPTESWNVSYKRASTTCGLSMELDLVSNERVYDHIHNEGFTWVMFRIIIV
jgi:hypothetical protein